MKQILAFLTDLNVDWYFIYVVAISAEKWTVKIHRISAQKLLSPFLKVFSLLLKLDLSDTKYFGKTSVFFMKLFHITNHLILQIFETAGPLLGLIAVYLRNMWITFNKKITLQYLERFKWRDVMKHSDTTMLGFFSFIIYH